jgi:hypothetical protein
MTDVANADRLRVKPKASPLHRPAGTSRVAELQVSAHLMTLETGLFCVFQTPGSPPPDPVTALPGVRITPAPGLTGRPEAVDVSTFREDGWLNGTAALVRVTDGSAQILVTIYQLKGADAAPQLQVLRLSGEAAKPEAAAAPAGALPAVAAEPPAVMAHVQSTGDVGGGLGAWIGTKGSRLWIEGFGVTPPAGVAAAELEYQGVLGRNWLSPWVAGGQYCGSRGMALPLLGLRLRLKGAAAKAYECSYAASFVDGSTPGRSVPARPARRRAWPRWRRSRSSSARARPKLRRRRGRLSRRGPWARRSCRRRRCRRPRAARPRRRR